MCANSPGQAATGRNEWAEESGGKGVSLNLSLIHIWRETFSADADRETYLQLIRLNLTDSGARVLGWCLMTNHVHLVVMPEREDSLAVLLRRVHGRYAQYYNCLLYTSILR